jgi:hypothetical protein
MGTEGPAKAQVRLVGVQEVRGSKKLSRMRIDDGSGGSAVAVKAEESVVVVVDCANEMTTHFVWAAAGKHIHLQ